MLTDIFADRYLNRELWNQYTEIESRLINQCFRIVDEQLFPYWINGKESRDAKEKWTSIHDRLSMELGLHELSPHCYSYPSTWMGKPYTNSGSYSMNTVCKNFVCAPYKGTPSADRFIKERISFVELAFRLKDQELSILNADTPSKIIEALQRETVNQGIRLTGIQTARSNAFSASKIASFAASVQELNERLRRAGTKLNYHNGFIQISSDVVTEALIEQPFWKVVDNPIWKNVDIDMKEAIDRRDANDRDPVFYAARALESAIKIISDQKGWTRGAEKGAHNYIDNLGAAKNGAFISRWECDVLKAFFTDIRNPFGHGPGSAEMPELLPTQTNWAIENCMSWIKSLVQRM